MNKDNQPAATLRLRVQNVQLLGGRSDGGQVNQPSVSETASTYSPSRPVEVAEPADDLPF